MMTMSDVTLPVDEPSSDSMKDHAKINQNAAEFLAWRRLHLSKAKLSGITEISTLMSGFAVVATVELQINDNPNPYLLSAFTVVTALLVCTTMMALMISTCILPYIQVIGKLGSHQVEAKESPHDDMMWFIDLSWVLANTISIFLFTLDVILLCWIKFTFFSVAASIAATSIMIPVLFVILMFGVVFYRKIIKHQYQIMDSKYSELEEMKRRIDSNLRVYNV